MVEFKKADEKPLSGNKQDFVCTSAHKFKKWHNENS